MAALGHLSGTKWIGSAELWLDPLGDQVVRGACTMTIDDDVVSYTWNHEGQSHAGSVTLRDDGASFVDTFHQTEPMPCRRVLESQGLFQVQGSYGAEADWGWRIGLSQRTPSGELVLQMTNIAPWGEEARAFRMTCARSDQPSIANSEE